MKHDLHHIFNQDKESTATLVSQELLKTGILQAEMTSEHIMYVYDSLHWMSSSPDFTSPGEILPPPSEKAIDEFRPVWGVIVETRKHPALERVVHNFLNNNQIPIQIFHGKTNLDFIMSTTLAELVQSGNVHLTQLNIERLPPQTYNALLLSKGFWKSVLGRKKIVIFQTDAVSCSQSDYTLDDFVAYDYIGSKWPRQRPVGLIIDGGSGGLSLRDWEKTTACLSRFPPEYWCGGEDGYFAFHIELIGGKVGKDDACAQFSTQGEFLCRSWGGGHKLSYLKKDAQAAFLDYCPEAKFILEAANKVNALRRDECHLAHKLAYTLR